MARNCDRHSRDLATKRKKFPEKIYGGGRKFFNFFALLTCHHRRSIAIIEKMNKNELQKFKLVLEKKKEELEGSLSSFATKDQTLKGDWDSKFPEFGDDQNVSLEQEADEVQEYITRLPVEHSYELRVQAITEALERMKSGTYGRCVKCKERIPQKRLEACPEAKFCLKCQSG